jgi:hypothetical protein
VRGKVNSHRDAVFNIGVKYQRNYRSVERLVNRPDEFAAVRAQRELF